MRDRFGATHPRALQLRFHTQTAGSTLAAQQPDNNIVRVAIQALAAVLGGTQSLHCNGRDEALALPTEDAAQIALRTQQIIAAETGVANTVDPVGGSWTIEARTVEIEDAAAGLIADIDRAGGTLAAIENGLHSAADPGRRLRRAAGHRPRRHGHRRREPLRDRGDHVDSAAPHRPGKRAAPGGGGPRAASRPGRRGLADGHRGGRTAPPDPARIWFPSSSQAVESRATLGEISDALRRVFGEHRELHA